MNGHDDNKNIMLNLSSISKLTTTAAKDGIKKENGHQIWNILSQKCVSGDSEQLWFLGPPTTTIRPSNLCPHPQTVFLITDRIRSVGEGYVFTSICLSTGGGFAIHPLGQTHHPQTHHPPPPGKTPPPWAPPTWIRQDTVNRRSVRILLECFLVSDTNCTYQAPTYFALGLSEGKFTRWQSNFDWEKNLMIFPQKFQLQGYNFCSPFRPNL